MKQKNFILWLLIFSALALSPKTLATKISPSPPAPAPRCFVKGIVQNVKFQDAYTHPCAQTNSCPTDFPVFTPSQYILKVLVLETSYQSGDTRFRDCSDLFPTGDPTEISILKEKLRFGDRFLLKGQKIEGIVTSFWGRTFESYTLENKPLVAPIRSFITKTQSLFRTLIEKMGQVIGQFRGQGSESLPLNGVSTSPSTTRPISTEAEAIAAVKQRNKEVRHIQKTSDAIGQSMDIRSKETVQGWKILFWEGSGDCPAGCLNDHEWYFVVEKSGRVERIGEHERIYNSRKNGYDEKGVYLPYFLESCPEEKTLNCTPPLHPDLRWKCTQAYIDWLSQDCPDIRVVR